MRHDLLKDAELLGKAADEVQHLRAALETYADKKNWWDAGELYGDEHHRHPRLKLWAKNEDGFTVAQGALDPQQPEDIFDRPFIDPEDHEWVERAKRNAWECQPENIDKTKRQLTAEWATLKESEP